MSRPKNKEYDLKERLKKSIEAGLNPEFKPIPHEDLLPELSERIQQMLQIIKNKPVKADTMNFLIMYDIENNKVRTKIAKYLESKGCIRIQKSIFFANMENKSFNDIHQTLAEVQSYYDNPDSILLVPFNTSDIRSMKIIGKELNIQSLVDKPNTLFF
jgi:CRISPR-associated endonuclease Cas2